MAQRFIHVFPSLLVILLAFIEGTKAVKYTVTTAVNTAGGRVFRDKIGAAYANRGLIEGIADYMSLKAGCIRRHWVKRGQGGRWDQGYDVTVRFLDYCSSLENGFVAELNKKMRTAYSDDYFRQILRKTVDQLWRDYKAKFGNNLEVSYI